MSLYAARMGLIDTENAFKVGPYIARLEAEGHKVVKCNLGEPDFEVPTHIRAEVKRQLDLDNAHYTDPQGILSLREAIAERIASTRGIPASADRVVVFPGGKPPIGLCQLMYCQPGDEIIYPSPGFPIYESFVRFVGATPVPLHLQEDKGFAFTGEDLAPLMSDKTRLIFMNFPSNPTGGVANREQLESIAKVIGEKGRPDLRVYTDEIYEDILFDGCQHLSPASMEGMAARSIVASGASKSYSWTGGRVGWAMFPTVDEAQVMKNMNINFFSCIPPYNQEGARVALTAPESRDSIAAMVDAFQKRRDIVVSGLNAIDGIRCQLPKGAFYVFPNIGGACESLGCVAAHAALPAEVRARTSPSSLFQMFLLFRHHTAAMDRNSFGRIGTEGMHYLRLSIATGEDELRRGLAAIARAVKDPDGFREFMASGGPYH